MKHLSIAITAMLLSGVALGDELVLKDGKTVPYTVMRDLGDSCEIETPDGVKLEIKKDQISKVVLKDRAAVKREEAADALTALTGATFTWDKKIKLTQFDLLKSVDLKKDSTGTWRTVGGSLVGKNNANILAKLFPPYIPPAEYDLTVSLERTQMGNGFAVILVGDGQKQVTFFLDIDKHSGMATIDGKGPETNGVGMKDPLFPKVGSKHVITFMVRKFGLLTKVDGKDYLGWKGDWSKVAPHYFWKDDNQKKTIYFMTGGGDSEFKISSAIVTFPKE
jgi:hypothetical protein